MNRILMVVLTMLAMCVGNSARAGETKAEQMCRTVLGETKQGLDMAQLLELQSVRNACSSFNGESVFALYSCMERLRKPTNSNYRCEPLAQK